jgi:hypothetical protein
MRTNGFGSLVYRPSRTPVLSSAFVRQAFTVAVILGLALAVLAPAFAAASPAADCGMSCCRVAGMPSPRSTSSMPSTARTSAMPPMADEPSMPRCAGPCGMRGGAGAPALATLAGLPPTVMPAVSPLAPPAAIVAVRQAAFRIPSSVSSDLPDRPPRA